MQRRTFLLSSSAAVLAAAAGKLPQRAGLQLYSLRREAETDLPGTLRLVRELGFREVEAGDFHGRSAQQFRALLDGSGLKAVSMGAGWNLLANALPTVATEARAVGAKWVTCSAIPKKSLTLALIEEAADNFNQWGRELRSAGLTLCFHPHGPEFVAGPDGTLFDTLAKKTDPKLVDFEMDVFWFVLGKYDPVEAFRRYPGRFPLMHLKDIRPGEPPTFDPGPVEEEASVPLGTGQVKWRPILEAARAANVQHYFIEEEHPNAVPQIRETLRYLEQAW